MANYIKGVEDTTLCRVVAVATYEKMYEALGAMLENAAAQGFAAQEIPETLQARYELLCVLGISEEFPEEPMVRLAWLCNTPDKRISKWDEAKLMLASHPCGLYYAVFAYADDGCTSQTVPAAMEGFRQWQQQVKGMYIAAITTDTYEVGTGTAEYTLIDGEITEDYDSYKEAAYVLYVREWRDNHPAAFREYHQRLGDMMALAEALTAYRFEKKSLPSETTAVSEHALYEAVATHVLFDGDAPLAEEMAMLSVLTCGEDDRNLLIADKTIADRFFVSDEDDVQTMVALFRLTYPENLSDEQRESYRKLVTRRAKRAAALALQGDRDHFLETLVQLGIYKPAHLTNTMFVPTKCRTLLDNLEKKQQEQAAAVLASMEQDAQTGATDAEVVYAAFEEEVVSWLCNRFDDDKYVCVRPDGTVFSDYDVCRSWSNLRQVIGISGMIVGLTMDGKVLCHLPFENAALSALAQELSVWQDVVQIDSNGMNFSYDKPMPVEKAFCVGIRKDGTVCLAGCVPRGSKEYTTWQHAAGLFADENCFGVWHEDGTVSAFGRLAMLCDYTDVTRVTMYWSWATVQRADGSAVYVVNKNTAYDGLKELLPLSHNWVSRGSKGFKTRSACTNCDPKEDELGLCDADGQYKSVRLNKFGMPLTFVGVYDRFGKKHALAVLYENGNVRLFANGRKPGEIVAKKVIKLEAKNGQILVWKA